eukprot:2173-Rhodomonas_salina.6
MRGTDRAGVRGPVVPQRLNSFCNVVLVLSLLRLIKVLPRTRVLRACSAMRSADGWLEQCTSMHPRLALLEGTVTKAWDDLWHAALLIVMLMGVFAGIATWCVPAVSSTDLALPSGCVMSEGPDAERVRLRQALWI